MVVAPGKLGNLTFYYNTSSFDYENYRRDIEESYLNGSNHPYNNNTTSLKRDKNECESAGIPEGKLVNVKSKHYTDIETADGALEVQKSRHKSSSFISHDSKFEHGTDNQDPRAKSWSFSYEKRKDASSPSQSANLQRNDSKRLIDDNNNLKSLFALARSNENLNGGDQEDKQESAKDKYFRNGGNRNIKMSGNSLERSFPSAGRYESRKNRQDSIGNDTSWDGETHIPNYSNVNEDKTKRLESRRERSISLGSPMDEGISNNRLKRKTDSLLSLDVDKEDIFKSFTHLPQNSPLKSTEPKGNQIFSENKRYSNENKSLRNTFVENDIRDFSKGDVILQKNMTNSGFVHAKNAVNEDYYFAEKDRTIYKPNVRTEKNSVGNYAGNDSHVLQGIGGSLISADKDYETVSKQKLYEKIELEKQNEYIESPLMNITVRQRSKSIENLVSSLRETKHHETNKSNSSINQTSKLSSKNINYSESENSFHNQSIDTSFKNGLPNGTVQLGCDEKLKSNFSRLSVGSEDNVNSSTSQTWRVNDIDATNLGEQKTRHRKVYKSTTNNQNKRDFSNVKKRLLKHNIQNKRASMDTGEFDHAYINSLSSEDIIKDTSSEGKSSVDEGYETSRTYASDLNSSTNSDWSSKPAVGGLYLNNKEDIESSVGFSMNNNRALLSNLHEILNIESEKERIAKDAEALEEQEKEALKQDQKRIHKKLDDLLKARVKTINSSNQTVIKKQMRHPDPLLVGEPPLILDREPSLDLAESVEQMASIQPKHKNNTSDIQSNNSVGQRKIDASYNSKISNGITRSSSFDSVLGDGRNSLFYLREKDASELNKKENMLSELRSAIFERSRSASPTENIIQETPYKDIEIHQSLNSEITNTQTVNNFQSKEDHGNMEIDLYSSFPLPIKRPLPKQDFSETVDSINDFECGEKSTDENPIDRNIVTQMLRNHFKVKQNNEKRNTNFTIPKVTSNSFTLTSKDVEIEDTLIVETKIVKEEEGSVQAIPEIQITEHASPMHARSKVDMITSMVNGDEERKNSKEEAVFQFSETSHRTTDHSAVINNQPIERKDDIVKTVARKKMDIITSMVNREDESKNIKNEAVSSETVYETIDHGDFNNQNIESKDYIVKTDNEKIDEIKLPESTSVSSYEAKRSNIIDSALHYEQVKKATTHSKPIEVRSGSMIKDEIDSFQPQKKEFIPKHVAVVSPDSRGLNLQTTEYYNPEENDEKVIKPSEFKVHRFTDKKRTTMENAVKNPDEIQYAQLKISPRVTGLSREETHKTSKSIIFKSQPSGNSNNNDNPKLDNTSIGDMQQFQEKQHFVKTRGLSSSEPLLDQVGIKSTQLTNNGSKQFQPNSIVRGMDLSESRRSKKVERWSNDTYINTTVGKINIPNSFQKNTAISNSDWNKQMMNETQSRKHKHESNESSKSSTPRSSVPKKSRRRFSLGSSGNTTPRTDRTDSTTVLSSSGGSRRPSSPSLGSRIKSMFSPKSKRKNKSSADEGLVDDDILRRLNMNVNNINSPNSSFSSNGSFNNGYSSVRSQSLSIADDDEDFGLDDNFLSTEEWLSSQQTSSNNNRVLNTKPDNRVPNIKPALVPVNSSKNKNILESWRVRKNVGKVTVPEVFSNASKNESPEQNKMENSRLQNTRSPVLIRKPKNTNRYTNGFRMNSFDVFNSFDVEK